MSDSFNPYHQWLGIPVGEQPPHYYRLLSVPLFEASPNVIENAADQRMAHLRTFQAGKHAAESQKLLNEVASARVCLLNAAKKAAYDQSLRERLAPVVRAVASAPASLDLAAVLSESRASASPVAMKHNHKKARPLPVGIIAAATAAVIIVALGMWAVLAHNGAPNEDDVAMADSAVDSAHREKRIAPPVSPGSEHSTRPGSERSKNDAPSATSVASASEPRSDDPQPVANAKTSDAQAMDDGVAVPALAAPSTPVGAKAIAADPAETKATSSDPASEKSESGEPQAAAKKIDPPSAAEQKRLMAAIDEVYKPGDAKDTAAKAALAHKLLDDGRKSETKPEQFVLLRRAGEIARDAGDVDTMLEAVDALAAAGFNIRAVPVKARLMKQLLEQGTVSGAIADSCVKFAKEAVDAGEFKDANEVLEAAEKAMLKAARAAQSAERVAKAALARARSAADKAERKKDLVQAQADYEAIKAGQLALAECLKETQKSAREFGLIEAARSRLKTSPDDAEACLAVGRWLCFHRGEWDEGLKLLAKSSDAKLKAVAAQELAAKPATADEKMARGDAWWNLGEKAAGSDKDAMLRRAGHWYEDALPDLSPGLEKARLEHRIAEVPKEGAPDAEASAPSAVPPTAKAPFDEKTAKAHQTRWARYLRVPVISTNSLGMKLAIIPPGEFAMGSSQELVDAEVKANAGDKWLLNYLGEVTVHQVRITKPFWLGVTSVTQEQFEKVMGGNPSHFSDDPKRPVEQVTCDQAITFCRRLSELPEEKAAHREYQLPTEAQWEFACRAGTTGRWSFSDPSKPISRAADEKLLGEYAWFGGSSGNSGGKTHPVAEKRPSVWGLYDMYGNVFQWCQDFYEPNYYSNSPVDDPGGPAGGTFRTCRGGSWFVSPTYTRSAMRFYHPSARSRHDIGFRVAAAVVEKEGK